MNEFSESLIFNRINPIVPNFSEYKKKSQGRKKRPKKEYAEVMKEITKEIEKSGGDEHINLKI